MYGNTRIPPATTHNDSPSASHLYRYTYRALDNATEVTRARMKCRIERTHDAWLQPFV